MIIQAKEGGDFKPHPEGIHCAVCVDVMDLGLCETNYQNQRKEVMKVKLVFETEEKTDDGRNCSVTKTFTQSLHPKAKLAEFLGKWRGKPITPGENVDLDKLIGANCTLVVSHNKATDGSNKVYANIDAVSKPTKKLKPSGGYDGAAARQRYAEWKLKQSGGLAPVPVISPMPSKSAAPMAQAVPKAAEPDESPFDPEVGF